ncbi:hypothetical protein TTHERM_00759020 (macronuclear) [Tetrahymena thermophila SB210]|uniref:Zinc carboxypeptidase family protein n=1 Tax=Tetrahymena thermophila (strain SB210) TaxID=312017 RepID=Q23JK3_TETTS|nr:hypothetical protein TTHERM_00759020 [Tetrahymena thermophila SB210]EAR96740.2 hypothetical protein TTHERM_00759020 [Tetrahymena thermophila SB210]|eukprot:XP_001016985.2 hypothetical protein TTHERM_00759020 [Tetrahymena thermophila SB210]
MDIENQKLKCKKHNQNEILFVKTDSLADEEDIFFCDLCLFSLQNFTLNNFTSMKQITNWSEGQVIYNFPPLKDNLILNQIMLLKQESQLNKQVLKINEFFEQLKCEVMQMLNEAQKIMNNLVSEMQEIDFKIMEKYNNLSKLKEFKNIITQNDISQDELVIQTKQFLKLIQQNKKSNSKSLESLIQEYQMLEQQIQLQKPEQIKIKLLDTLKDFSYLYKQEKIQQNLMTKYQDLLPQIQFSKYLFEPYYSSSLSISQNQLNQFLFTSKLSNKWGSFYSSNLIIESDKKYIFKLKAEQLDPEQDNYMVFGLVRDETKDKDYCTKDFLSCSLCYQNNKCYISQYVRGLSKIIRGNFKDLPTETEIEFRICINKNIFQITELPNKNHRAVLDEKSKQNLKKYQNLRFFIGMENKIQITLLEAKVKDN